MAKRMPKIIFINLLAYNLRNDNPDVVQPVKFMYTKPPVRAAIPNIQCYNVQLPRIMEMKPDFNQGFYCWSYALYTAHKNNLTINEVISMTPELQTYAEKNPGFTQFDQRYRHETASPELRNEYVSWVLAEMKVEGAREGGWIDGHAAGRMEGHAEGRMEGHTEGRTEGHAVGRVEGHAEGRTEGFDISVEVIRLLRNGESAGDIANKLSIPVSQVSKLQALV